MAPGQVALLKPFETAIRDVVLLLRSGAGKHVAYWDEIQEFMLWAYRRGWQVLPCKSCKKPMFTKAWLWDRKVVRKSHWCSRCRKLARDSGINITREKGTIGTYQIVPRERLLSL